MLFGVFLDVDIIASPILLVALVRRVLLDVALLPLLVGIHSTAAVRGLIGGRLLVVAGSFRALVGRWNGRHFSGHGLASVKDVERDARAGLLSFSSTPAFGGLFP
jgi:hypothetical protein